MDRELHRGLSTDYRLGCLLRIELDTTRAGFSWMGPRESGMALSDFKSQKTNKQTKNKKPPLEGLVVIRQG